MKLIKVLQSHLYIRLLLIVGVAFTLIMATNGMVLIMSINQVGQETIQKQLTEEQLIIEQRFEELQLVLQETAVATARYPAIMNGVIQSDTPSIERYLQSSNPLARHDLVWVVDKTNTVVGDNMEEKAIQPIFDSNNTLQTHLIIWEDMPLLAAFAPIYDAEQQIIGTVILADIIDSQWLGEMNFSRDTVAFTLFVEGLILPGISANEANGQPHLNQAQVEALHPKPSLIESLRKEEPIRLFDIAIRGTPHAVIYHPLLINGEYAGYYAIAIDETEPRIIQNRILAASILMVVIVIIMIGALITISLNKMVILPLQRLNLAAQQIANGNYDTRISVRSRDEIGRLGSVFNLMASSIETRTTQLNELNLILEHRVRERTIALERQTAWLETILCEAKEAIIVTSEDGRIRLVNETAHQKIVDTSRMDASFFEMLQPFAHPLPQFPLTTGGYRGDIAMNNRFYQCSITHLPTTQDFEGGFVCILTDITDIHRLDALKTQVIRMAAHDLQSPLTSLQLQYYLLKKQADSLSERQMEIIERAQASVADLRSMISGLLNLEYIESQAQGQCETIHVGTLLSSGITLLKSELEHKNLHIHLAIADSIPFVCGDPVRLLEAIRNYLTNAIKYTPKDGSLKARVYADQSHVYLEIEDTGIGIDTEDVVRVFEANFRAQTAWVSSEPGQGIGLSLVKAIIEEHGGQVWVSSQVGSGSIFGFKLPIAFPILG